MRISDWSSDVCSSDLKVTARTAAKPRAAKQPEPKKSSIPAEVQKLHKLILKSLDDDKAEDIVSIDLTGKSSVADYLVIASGRSSRQVGAMAEHLVERSEEHTSELQSLMRISYAVFC